MKLIRQICQICLISLIVVFPVKVKAQQVGLSINPPVVQILLAPNKKFIQTFSIVNQGESGNFVASLHHAKSDGIDGHAIVDPHPLDLSSIAIIPRLENADLKLGEPFLLEKGKPLQLVLSLEGSSIENTEDTYLALVVQKDTSGDPDTTITSPGISSLIFVTLTGDSAIPVKLDISNFDFPAFLDSGIVVHIQPLLENNSSVMLRPEGNLSIINPQGKEIYQIDIYNNLILGNSKRIIQGKDSSKSPINIVWSPKFTAVGPYTLKLTIETTGKTKILEAERVIWLLPIRILIVLLLAIIITILLIILKRRRLKQIQDSNS